jgi:FlaA1/EpsC-like NDP-sugar epimerase
MEPEEGRSLSDKAKRNILMLADALVLMIALWGSVALRYGDVNKDVSAFWFLFPVAAFVGIIAFQKLELYRAIVQYIGPSSILPVIQGVTLAAIAISLVAFLSNSITFPRSAPVIFWFMAVLMIGGGRIVVRVYFYGWFNNYLVREAVAIYGGGDSGAQLAIALLNGNEYMPVAFLDDNRELRRNTIHGIRVYEAKQIESLIETFGIKRIFLAIPSATSERRRHILNTLAELPIHINTVPEINNIVTGMMEQPVIREIEIGDLLGRDIVPPDEELLTVAIQGKNILITGAAGTIGSEIAQKNSDKKTGTTNSL